MNSWWNLLALQACCCFFLLLSAKVIILCVHLQEQPFKPVNQYLSICKELLTLCDQHATLPSCLIMQHSEVIESWLASRRVSELFPSLIDVLQPPVLWTESLHRPPERRQMPSELPSPFAFETQAPCLAYSSGHEWEEPSVSLAQEMVAPRFVWPLLCRCCEIWRSQAKEISFVFSWRCYHNGSDCVTGRLWQSVMGSCCFCKTIASTSYELFFISPLTFK